MEEKERLAFTRFGMRELDLGTVRVNHCVASDLWIRIAFLHVRVPHVAGSRRSTLARRR